MRADYIQKIEALASKFPNRDVTLYFPDFEAPPSADNLNQVFGAPVGVKADNWPTFAGLPALLEQIGEELEDPRDLRMELVCQIDLRGLDALGAPAEARLMQLYLSNAGFNEAWAPNTDHARVVFLSNDEVAGGRFKGELPARSQDRDVRRFTLVPVTVPGAVFAVAPEDKDTPLGKLNKAIWAAPARLGGEPIWLQGDPDEDESYDAEGDDEDAYDDEDGEDDDDNEDNAEDEKDAPAPRAKSAPLGMKVAGGFYMQFDDGFADVNLGDSGVMYVFGNDAHFQCY
jgi:hypothetical protein